MAWRSTPRNLLFDGRWFEDEIIILCLRWYFRYTPPASHSDVADLSSHLGQLMSIDFFTIPVTLRVLFVFIVLEHFRREILHFNVTEHPRMVKELDVGGYLGLRPKRRDSGASRPQLRITKEGDVYYACCWYR